MLLSIGPLLLLYSSSSPGLPWPAHGQPHTGACTLLAPTMRGGGLDGFPVQAMFSGVCRGPQDLAEYAATLSQGQLRALGFRLDQHTGEIRCPGVTPFRTVLRGVDASAVERALLRW